MGMFGGSSKQKASYDEADLLLTAALLAVASDGGIDEQEQAALVNLCFSYPKLKNAMDIGEKIKENSERLVKAMQNDTLEVILKEFTSIDESLKKQCLMIAMEGALANGEVVEKEEQFLENFKNIMQLDDDYAAKMSE